MVGNPFDRFARDLAAAGRDLDDLTQARRDGSEQLAAAVRDEAPYVTGYLVSTVFADDGGVGIGAMYAGVVHDSNPYTERALDRADPAEAVADYVDEVFDAHLQPIYF